MALQRTTPHRPARPSRPGSRAGSAARGVRLLIGRSRGGLTTKIHAAVDGHGRPLAAVVTGGQRNDGAVLASVLADIRVLQLGAGRPRTRPAAVIADRAYSSGVTRRMLAARGIKAVVPQKKDEIAARQRKGSLGGRVPHLDAAAYTGQQQSRAGELPAALRLGQAPLPARPRNERRPPRAVPSRCPRRGPVGQLAIPTPGDL